MQAPTLADVMLESVLPETYHPKQFRKSNVKIRPMGGGRIPSQVAKWDDFEPSLHAWWTGQGQHRRRSRPRDVLTGVHASRIYMRDCAPGISICKEDEVRGALMVCVFAPVNEALGPSGLNIPFKLNATESIHCVASNVDWAGFIVQEGALDIFQQCRLPIEVKPPWQFQLSPDDGHVVDLLLSLNATDRDKVRFAVAQLYLYMILEEAEFGVLCSKEQYVFFMRVGNPADKSLLISRTFSCGDPISIRRCLLFMCHLAHGSRVISMAAVDQAGPTPLKDKLVTPKGQKRACNQVGAPSGRRLRRRSCPLSPTLHETSRLLPLSPTLQGALVLLSAQDPTARTRWIRPLHIAGKGLEEWFQKLAEFDLLSFQLGKVLSSHGKVIVREACIWSKTIVIKLFDLIEDPQDTLLEFYQEVCAYTTLEDLQGEAVPELLAYGSIWGGYMGFLALTNEGHVLCPEELEMEPSLAASAIRTLNQIHGAKVLHGDLSFRNMVVSSEGVKFIDFGRCCLQAEQQYLRLELEELGELLNEGLLSPQYSVVI